MAVVSSFLFLLKASPFPKSCIFPQIKFNISPVLFPLGSGAACPKGNSWQASHGPAPEAPPPAGSGPSLVPASRAEPLSLASGHEPCLPLPCAQGQPLWKDGAWGPVHLLRGAVQEACASSSGQHSPRPPGSCWWRPRASESTGCWTRQLSAPGGQPGCSLRGAGCGFSPEGRVGESPGGWGGQCGAAAEGREPSGPSGSSES